MKKLLFLGLILCLGSINLIKSQNSTYECCQLKCPYSCQGYNMASGSCAGLAKNACGKAPNNDPIIQDQCTGKLMEVKPDICLNFNKSNKTTLQVKDAYQKFINTCYSKLDETINLNGKSLDELESEWKKCNLITDIKNCKSKINNLSQTSDKCRTKSFNFESLHKLDNDNLTKQKNECNTALNTCYTNSNEGCKSYINTNTAEEVFKNSNESGIACANDYNGAPSKYQTKDSSDLNNSYERLDQYYKISRCGGWEDFFTGKCYNNNNQYINCINCMNQKTANDVFHGNCKSQCSINENYDSAPYALTINEETNELFKNINNSYTSLDKYYKASKCGGWKDFFTGNCYQNLISSINTCAENLRTKKCTQSFDTSGLDQLSSDKLIEHRNECNQQLNTCQSNLNLISSINTCAQNLRTKKCSQSFDTSELDQLSSDELIKKKNECNQQLNTCESNLNIISDIKTCAENLEKYDQNNNFDTSGLDQLSLNKLIEKNTECKKQLYKLKHHICFNSLSTELANKDSLSTELANKAGLTDDQKSKGLCDLISDRNIRNKVWDAIRNNRDRDNGELEGELENCVHNICPYYHCNQPLSTELANKAELTDDQKSKGLCDLISYFNNNRDFRDRFDQNSPRSKFYRAIGNPNCVQTCENYQQQQQQQQQQKMEKNQCQQNNNATWNSQTNRCEYGNQRNNYDRHRQPDGFRQPRLTRPPR